MTAAERPVAWVDTVAPGNAGGVLEQAYDIQASFIGEPTEFALVGSLHPKLVRGRMEFYRIIDQLDTSLTEAEKHAIIYVTSMLNQAPYCASGTRHLLEHGGMPAGLIDQLGGESAAAADATGDPRLDEIVRYTTILTRSPADVTEQDIAALRKAGLSDGDIVAVNNLAAYFAYCNRITLGLGLRTQMPADHAIPRWSKSS